MSGIAKKTPTVIYATTDGMAHPATSSSTRVYPQSNGYWIDGKDSPTTFLGLNGTRQFYIDQDVTWGNAFSAFTYEGTSYAMVITYDPMLGQNWSWQTSEERAKNYTNGRTRQSQLGAMVLGRRPLQPFGGNPERHAICA